MNRRLLAVLLVLGCGTAGSSLLLASPAEAATRVTSAVLQAGSGVYTTRNVQAGTGYSAHAGWSLVVAYRDPAEPWRSLIVYTRYEFLKSVYKPVISVSGFTAPSTGPVVTATTDATGDDVGTVSAGVLTARLGTGNGDATHPAATSNLVTEEVTGYLGQVVIIEFRNSGPVPTNDSYVELHNTGPAVPLAGFQIQSTSGTTTTLPPGAGTLGAGRSYLITGGQYSPGAVAASDYPTGTTLGSGGLRALAPDTAGTRSDAVGPDSGYHLGNGLPELSSAPSDQYAWVRDETTRRAGNITNTSETATITAAKLRVTALSAANGAPRPGVITQPASHANLRIVDPPVVNRGAPARYLSVDDPATGLGGGLNSTLTLPLGAGLAPGDSISIAVTFDVDTIGPFWSGYDIDATEAALPNRLGVYAAPATQRPVSAPSNAIHGVL